MTRPGRTGRAFSKFSARMILVLVVIGFCTVLLGRLQFGIWFNPVSAYSAIWTISLSLFEMKLIYFYPLAPETWAVIFAGWTSFILGCLAVTAARFATRPAYSPVPQAAGTVEFSPEEIVLLRRVLWVLNTVALVIAVQHITTILRKFGNIGSLVVFAQTVYETRTRKGIEGAVPYFGSAMLIGSLVGGIYSSAMGKLKLAGVLPVVLTVAVSFAEMGRMSMMIAVLMFVTGYVLNRRRVRAPEQISVFSVRVRRIIALAMVLVIVGGGAELVRSARVPFEQFAGTTRALSKLRGGSFVTPSVYLYMTGHHGALNQYLRQDVEHSLPGGFTFAPIWRLLSKLGYDTYVDQYQRFYRTPTPSNTGTYLRELHADWGLPGVVFGPFILGMLISVSWYRTMTRHRMVDYVIAAHLFVAVVMSYVDLVTQLGYWLASLVFGLIAAAVYDRRTMKISGARHGPAAEPAGPGGVA